MSTITGEFTKEQLIAKAREQIEFCRNTKITGEGRVHVNQCSALFEIALAALTAAPAAWTDEDELEDMESTGRAYIFKSRRAMGHPDPGRVVKLYRLPLQEAKS